MSLQAVTMWRIACDWPGCKGSPLDDTDYYAWSDPVGAIDSAEDNGWRGRDGKSHYCNNHPTTWASDHENGEPFPDPPYLLVHDGDTGDYDDDGKVSLIGEPK